MNAEPRDFIYGEKTELRRNLFDLFMVMDNCGGIEAIPEMEKFLNNRILSGFPEDILLAEMKEHLLNGEYEGVKLTEGTRERCLKWVNERGEQQLPVVHSIIPDNILDRLYQVGFIKKEPLKWMKSKALLAYFVEVANDELNLRRGEKRQVRPFEIIFNTKGLTGAKNDYKKTGVLPFGHKEIDKIFQ